MMRFNRRAFFKYTGLSLLASSLSKPAEAGTFFWRRMFSVPPRDTPFITPNDQFYLVNYDGIPDVKVATWNLSISGYVKRPVTLTYADILSRPSVEAMVTLECIDTLPGGSTISNAVWRGIPLKDVLEEAGLEPGAADVVFYAAEGYSDSIPLSRVMQSSALGGSGGDILLAHSMNGVALPRDHGFPLRVITPGLYGIKNVKWLIAIEVVDYDYKGYWQQRGWTDEGQIKVISRIDSPGHYQDLKGPEAEIRGIAFGGAQGVGKVEISTNGGKTWHLAEITQAYSPTAWVLWRYSWRIPGSGAHTIVVRATDGQGRSQPSQILQAYPAGSSGLHTIVALVS